MTPRRVAGRAAAVAALLLLAGCASGAYPLLGLFGPPGEGTGRGQAAALQALARAPDDAADGAGGVPAAETAPAPVEPATQLASLPAPGGLLPAKPPAARAPSCATPAPGGRTSGTVMSDGHPFAIDCFRAASDAPAPAVLILHGSRGIGRNTVYERLAERLAERGYNAFILQYLRPAEPADAAKAGPPSAARGQGRTAAARSEKARIAAARTKTPPRRRLIDNESQARAIEDAITAIQALAYVDHGGIGLFGLSLGGFHALAIAAHDTRVKAVVNMFGAMPRQSAPGVYRMPPTLILHGDRDNVVPVRRAHELARLLKEIGATHELKVYKGQGHSFRGAADQDSLERATEFLLRWLGAKPGPDDRAG